MKLLRVKLHGFGAFNKGLEVNFDEDRLNLVVGRNEAGKSTLLNSMFGILFGFRDLNLVRKYKPWDDHEEYAGELDMSVEDGTRYRIRRNFSTNHASIEALRDGETEILFDGISDPRGSRDEDFSYYEELGAILGFKDEAIFRGTVFFGQQSLQTAVSDQIRRLISGSIAVDYKGALHELHSRYSDLTTENPWKSRSRGRERLIEKTQRNLHAGKTRLQEGGRALSRTLELEEEIGALSASLAELESDLARERESHEAHEKLFEFLQRRDEAGRRYGETLARRDNYRRYADRAAKLEEETNARYSHFRHAPEDFPDQVRAYAHDQSEMERELDALANERKLLEQLRPRPNQRNGLTTGSVVVGAGLIAGAVTGIGLAVGAVAGAAGGLLGYNLGRQVGTGFKEERARLAERIRTLQASVKSRRKRCDETLSAVGSTLVGRDPEEVLAEHRGFRELKEERKRVTAAMKALGSRDQVESEFEDVSRERGIVGAALEELVQRHPSLASIDNAAAAGVRIEDVARRIRLHQERGTDDRERLEACRIERAGLNSTIDFNLTELEEEVHDNADRLAGYDLERDALKEAIDTLDVCIKDFQEGDAFRLAQEISGIFSKITGEKYTRVQLGASLEPIISRGDSVPISPMDLSQGAQDQLYFAMRVAMARHLSRNTRLPLFLDDPFVNFDEERLKITREVLDHLDDHQIIMVTCDRGYQSWTEAVIDMDAARAVA